MHRQRTRIAKRATRVASSLERRGIVATYELHDRLLSNRRSRQRFAATPHRLDAVQQRIVDDLGRDGYAKLAFSDLFPEPDTWERVAAQGDDFIARTARALEDGGQLKTRAGKEFVAREYSFEGVTLGLDSPWFGVCASRRMLDIANTYLRLMSKLSYVDLWYTAPQDAAEERVASQLWHFDFDDRHLLKAFLYLTDVGPADGPFEFVPGSQPGGRHHHVRPWRPMGYGRVSDEDVARSVPAGDIVTFTAPRGSLIFCNTSGLHRGGFATGHPRVLATATYCSPASLQSLSVRNYTAAATPDDPVVAYALT